MRNFNRKEFIKKIIVLTGFYLLSDAIRPLFRALGVPIKPDRSTIAVIKGKDLSKTTIASMVNEGFRQMGGIDLFIKKGMTVVIKPNIGWDSPPERAHNTNPDLVEAVAKACIGKGAKVLIFDRTCDKDRFTYETSGIMQAARNAGASISYIDNRKFREVNVPGYLSNKTLTVYEDILNADCVINMPIAKTHGSSTLTLAMKNLMGLIGGRRGFYHQDLHRSIVDFNKAIRVHLVILDATRILTAKGPNGGTLKDVKVLRTIVMGTNPVTVDAYATSFFNMTPSSIGYIALAGRQGMGEININKIKILSKMV
jgi:uncharacterized protein (DUF362 family)